MFVYFPTAPLLVSFTVRIINSSGSSRNFLPSRYEILSQLPNLEKLHGEISFQVRRTPKSPSSLSGVTYMREIKKGESDDINKKIMR